MSLSVGLLKISRDKEKLPVVLLPAFPFNVDFWLPVAERLSNTSFIVNPPGFPISGTLLGENDYFSVALKNTVPSLADYAQAVLDLLREQGIKRFVVAGCSMGGYTALAMLAQAPECIGGLGLFDTNAQADTPLAQAARLSMADSSLAGNLPKSFLKDNIGLLSPINQTQVSLVHFVEKQVKAAVPAALAWAQRAMAKRIPRQEMLAESRGIPAVVARGVDDEKSTITQCQEMARALGVKPLNIGGAGHLLPLEKPDKVAQLLEELA